VATLTYPDRPAPEVVVLVDHQLGGGVKDCWVSRTPGRTGRADHQGADRHSLEIVEYDPGHARTVLERALSRPACPVSTDQIDHIRHYLALLRQRVTLLPHSDETLPEQTPPRNRIVTRRPAPTRAVSGSGVHRLKVTLAGARPPIWRRVEVPSASTLERLHQTIQTAFGWYGCHRWVFETPSGQYGLPDFELGHAEAAAACLHSVAPDTGDRIRYVYDFGDDWRHDILVEDVLPFQPGATYPPVHGRAPGPPAGGLRRNVGLHRHAGDPHRPRSSRSCRDAAVPVSAVGGRLRRGPVRPRRGQRGPGEPGDGTSAASLCTRHDDARS
jgi:hypothetical protein